MGFEYIELGLSGIAALSEDDFSALSGKVVRSPLKPEVFNVMVPGSVKLTGPEVSREKTEAYLDLAFGRASALGGSVVVFGSGGARMVPDGFDREVAFGQLADFLSLAGNKAGAAGLTIAIEPLRTAECNIINSGAEAVELARRANHEKVRILIDFYHLSEELEDPSIVLTAGNGMLLHTHIARPGDRRWPQAVDEAAYLPFFRNLAQIGYEGRMSIEGKSDDFMTDGPTALNVLREIAAAALS